jgi:hypothetical protein
MVLSRQKNGGGMLMIYKHGSINKVDLDKVAVPALEAAALAVPALQVVEVVREVPLLLHLKCVGSWPMVQ